MPKGVYKPQEDSVYDRTLILKKCVEKKCKKEENNYMTNGNKLLENTRKILSSNDPQKNKKYAELQRNYMMSKSTTDLTKCQIKKCYNDVEENIKAILKEYEKLCSKEKNEKENLTRDTYKRLKKLYNKKPLLEKNIKILLRPWLDNIFIENKIKY